MRQFANLVPLTYTVAGRPTTCFHTQIQGAAPLQPVLTSQTSFLSLGSQETQYRLSVPMLKIQPKVPNRISRAVAILLPPRQPRTYPSNPHLGRSNTRPPPPHQIEDLTLLTIRSQNINKQPAEVVLHSDLHNGCVISFHQPLTKFPQLPFGWTPSAVQAKIFSSILSFGAYGASISLFVRLAPFAFKIRTPCLGALCLAELHLPGLRTILPVSVYAQAPRRRELESALNELFGEYRHWVMGGISMPNTYETSIPTAARSTDGRGSRLLSPKTKRQSTPSAHGTMMLWHILVTRMPCSPATRELTSSSSHLKPCPSPTFRLQRPALKPQTKPRNNTPFPAHPPFLAPPPLPLQQAFAG